MSSQQSEKKKPFYQKVTPYLYGAALASFLWGQVHVFQESFAAGLLYTFLSFLPLGLAVLGEKRLIAAGKQLALFIEEITLRAKEWEKRRKEKPVKPPVSEETSQPGPERDGDIVVEDSPVEVLTEPVKRKSLFEFHNPFEKLSTIELKVPRMLLLGCGIVLLLAAQPFLFLELFFIAIALIIPGLAIFLGCFLRPEKSYSLGRLDIILKAFFLALPGIALIIFGNIILVKYVHIYWQKELLGIGSNVLGILMILAVMPSKLVDPDMEPGNPWDHFDGLAKSKWGVFLKIFLVIVSLVLFYLARHYAGTRQLWHALTFTLTGMGAVIMSFPWQMDRSNKKGEMVLPLRLLLNLARLVAFVLAIYLAYQGQKLIGVGQLTPSLIKFGLAAIALVFAFREPLAGKEDRFQEKPLKWYWELLGLMAVLAVAVWVRTHLLDSIPYGVEGDEAAGHVNAGEILKGQNYSIVAHPAGQPIFYLIHLKLSSMFLGLDNLGVRFHALFYGIIDILVMFLFARMLYGPRTAMATAALFSFSRWHIHFSRFGYGNTLLILVLMLGFYFLLKGLKSRSKWYFVMAGMSWAYALQTEVAARLLPVICLGILIYLTIRQRRFLIRNWKPLVALFLGVWLTGAGMLILFGKSTTALFGRAQSVSIFSQDPNAPVRNIAEGFIGSIKSSLTMLNWRGDFRTRHNGGLSGEPMLDFWTGLLFMLGFGLSIYYWKRLRYFVPLIWFFGFMCASIFAIEAPQGHRAFGIIPAVFLMIGAFLDRSRRLLQETFGRLGIWIALVLFVMVFIPIAKTNYQKYFNAEPGYDTNCTAAAKYIGQERPKDEHYVMSAYLWQGHPPFMLYAGNISGAFYYAASEVVPVTKETEQDVTYSMLLEYPPLLKSLQAFYPEGIYKEEIHSKYGSQFKAWTVSNEEIMKTRGLTAKYYNNMNWQGQPQIERKDNLLTMKFDQENWPLDGNGSVEWEGTVYVPHEGNYTLYVYATDEIEVTLTGKHKFRAANKSEDVKTIWLSGGLNKIRARAKKWSKHSRIAMAWSCKESAGYYLYKSPYQKAFRKVDIPETHFFTYAEPKGLLGTFYSNADFTGSVLHEKVEPALMFAWMGRPYGFAVPLSVEWKGWITVDEPGDYKFELNCSGYGEVEVDRKLVWQRGTPPKNSKLNKKAINPVYLTPGKYPISVRWSWAHTSIFNFWWTPPKGERELVPASVLSPAVK